MDNNDFIGPESKELEIPGVMSSPVFPNAAIISLFQDRLI